MINPRLRIVLVDTDHSRRLSIEKNLGQLGCYRVIPVSSLHELMALMDNAIGVFDLLVINEDVVCVAGIRLENILRDYSCIRHSLIYKSVELHVFPGTYGMFPSSRFFASGVPDQPVLAQVMSRLEESAGSEVYNPLSATT